MVSPTSPQSDNDKLLRQFSRLVEISLTLNSTLDPDQLLQSIIRSAAELLDCEAASILLYDEARNQLFFATASEDSRQLAQIPVPLEGSIAGTIFRENRPMVINHVEADPRHYQQVGEQISFQTHTLLGVPMRIKARTTGVLEALNKHSGEFNENDTRLLSVIASQAAVAIHNAQLLHALQKANEDLRRVDKVKSDFIAIASHELRTPLGVILGYATILKEDASGELSEHADMVLNSALKMRSLVEDMTNLSLMQMGSTKLNLRPAPIQDIVQHTLDDTQESARMNHTKLTASMPAKPLMVNAEPEKLGRVFSNLLDNAVRFSPAGCEVNVCVRQVRKEVWVQVNDNGIGIPQEELENIFREFYQLEDHLRRHMGGMGIGLSIARGLVKLHHGRIWAESAGVGKGSTFTVALPMVVPAAPAG